MTLTDTEPRYRIGERDTTGRYPVDVDGSPAGHIHRWHGDWYAAAPGQDETRHPDRESAAGHLEKLTGQRATGEGEPAQAEQPPSRTRYVPWLSPRLQPTPRNILSAATALARLQELAWEPLEGEGYPGADNPWPMRCLLCGWEGPRWWSHLRGRNGDKTPRPKYRHDGCLPLAEHAGKVAALTRTAQSCNCTVAHPTTVETVVPLLESVARGRRTKDATSLTADLSRLLGPCPAATLRAVAIETALTAAKS